MMLIDGNAAKTLRSGGYNYDFCKRTGVFRRWGYALDHDPQWSPFGPEIADIEISKHGCPNLCAYCYKENTKEPPINMSLELFRVILDKLGPQLTQVAFGITGVQTNPDFIPMMQHCRQRGIVPNFTLSGSDLTDTDAHLVASLAGAIAVSFHGNYDLCFDTVERLVRCGAAQVNIHAVTTGLDALEELIHNIAGRREISPAFKLHALVLLSLKPKGRARGMQNISLEDLGRAVRLAEDTHIPLGFDSCSAHAAFALYPPRVHSLIEPCESGLFSAYIDTFGFFHPCSFAEGEWDPVGVGLDVFGCEDFLSDIWLSPQVDEWRHRLLANNRTCPLKFAQRAMRGGAPRGALDEWRIGVPLVATTSRLVNRIADYQRNQSVLQRQRPIHLRVASQSDCCWTDYSRCG